MVDVFVQYERAIIRARTKAALGAKRARGERAGAVPFGYRAGEGGRLEAHFATGCAEEIQTVHRKLIAGAPVFLGAMRSWLDDNRTKLRPMLRGRSPSDACENDNLACKMPVDDGQQDPDTHYSRVMGIECTKPLFQCGPPEKVCWINKVAVRLGIRVEGESNYASGNPYGILRARTTGTVIAGG